MSESKSPIRCRRPTIRKRRQSSDSARDAGASWRTVRTLFRTIAGAASFVLLFGNPLFGDDGAEGAAFFEKHIRPILVTHCYECHSEKAMSREGGLLLDRESGWLQGGDGGAVVVPGEPEQSRLLIAVRYDNDSLQMPPEKALDEKSVTLLAEWIRRGAPGPQDDMGETEFSKLGDQSLLFSSAKDHWAFQPIAEVDPPRSSVRAWDQHAVDRFIIAELQKKELQPSPVADPRTLLIRLSWNLTGLPPTPQQLQDFLAACEQDSASAMSAAIDRFLDDPGFGQHLARMWLDVARYADTDSSYRPDTRTPHYFPFAFTYRDYVVDAFNADKPFDQFVREQLAADLLYPTKAGEPAAPEVAALGFLTVGPHANQNVADAVDDWIDVTTRGLLGLTAACARCHDHKFEPIPTADYYALHGIFASVTRVDPLDEDAQPTLNTVSAAETDVEDYRRQRAAIDAKIKGAGNSKSRNNNRSVAEKIRETELAELLLFHPGAPAKAMVVQERKKPVVQYVFERGEPRNRGPQVTRHFLTVLDPQQQPFNEADSGRLDLANQIVSPANPLTSRVFVNRVWGLLMGSYLVGTPSDFGLQGEQPTHPELLDWLAADFMKHQWSVKHLVRTIVSSRTWQQRSGERSECAEVDPTNRLLWRANRQHLTIENLRDGLLQISGQLDPRVGGRAAPLWGDDYTKRRAIYGYINRFNLDPTLGVFDFPSPMQTQAKRVESIVATQALFSMNSPFVIDQTVALTERSEFRVLTTDAERIHWLFEQLLLRTPASAETERIEKFLAQQTPLFEKNKRKTQVSTPWPLIAQAIVMGNEFMYID